MRLIATIAAAVCAVAVNAASLVWLPGFGDAAKGAYRGARNAVEEVGEAAAKNMDNVGRAIPEIGRVQTDFIDGATVTSFGKTIGTGTVDVQSTIKGIENGTVLPRTEFNNKEGLLPSACVASRQ